MPDQFTSPRRLRFGLRKLFVLVTVAALAMFAGQLSNRSVGYSRRATFHSNCKSVAFSVAPEDQVGESVVARRLEVYLAHHRQLQEKYERAARYPWLGVEPDPSEPLLFENLPPTERATEERTP